MCLCMCCSMDEDDDARYNLIIPSSLTEEAGKARFLIHLVRKSLWINRLCNPFQYSISFFYIGHLLFSL